MKKLIALIGAVATAFGLYATDLTKSAVSFESAEPGCSGETFNWQADGMWATDYDDVFKFGAVVDEATYTGAYTGTTRRNDEFTYGQSQNDQFLKLSTGTNSLQRLFAAKEEDAETAVSTDPIFMDQLVKFTGYEDTQTVFAAGTKVAVWMSEFVIGEENDAEITQTNLYVAVGSVSGGNVTMKNVKIAGEYKLDTWYRLTIRSIGNIYGAGAVPSALSGFAIYINGAAIVISQEDQGLLDNADNLIPKAAVLYSKGQLFPSMDAGSTTLKSVGFEGMGGIDDMIVDNVGPDFAQEANFKFADITGAKVLVVSNETENTELIADANGYYTAIPGQKIGVYFTAKGPYVLKPDPLYKSFDAEAGTDTIEFSDVKPKDAVAAIEETYYASMADALEAVQYAFTVEAVDEVTVEVLAEGADYVFTLDETEYTYTFAKGTITVTKGSDDDVSGNWDIYISEENEEQAMSEDFGAMPEKQIHITFDDSEAGVFNLAGNIYGNGRVDTLVWVEGTTKLTDALVIGATFLATDGAGATLKTDALDLDGNQITLDGKGKVMVKTALTVEDAFTNDADDIAVTEPADDGDYYIYALKQGATFTINPIEHTTITCEGANWDATLQKWVAPKAGADVEVTVTADDGYLFSDGTDEKTETIQAVDGETFTLKIAAPTEAKAKKGLKFFITLKDALDDDATEGDITLLANATLDNYTLTKAVVLNLDGFNLTGGTGTKQHKIFTLLNDADLTINGADSTITGNIYLGVNNGVSAANLTLNGGTYQQATEVVDEAVIQVNGGDTGTKAIAATGCTFSSTDDTFYLAGPATTTLTGCTVTGATGIYAKSGTITLVNTAVTGNGLQQAPQANGNGARSTGDAVIFDTITGYQGDMTLNVNGTSSLSSVNGYAFQETVTRGTESGTLHVTIADTATVGAVKLSDQFAAKVAAGSASITGYVATVNGIAYKTAAEALVAVQAAEAAGATEIKVNAIDALSVTTEDEQSLTVAKGGTITVTASGWALTGTVTGNVNLALGKTLSVPEGTVITVNPPEGYRVAKSTVGGITTYSIEEIPYIAKNTTTEEQYKDLATAISEAADGETIQLIADGETFEFDGEGVRVAGKAITLDLNGKKLTGKAYMPTAIKEQRMIYVASDGDLTVLDSTVAEGGYGDGELHFEYINSGSPKYSAGYYLILNQGKLTVKSGKLTARDYADHTWDEGDLVYAIENRSNGNSAELVIEGGYISVPDHNGQCAVRLYAYDSAEPKYVNKATITGGILDNVYPFCMTIPHQGAKCDVNISGGTFNGYCRLTGDKYGYSKINITGGTFNGNVEGFDIQDPLYDAEYKPTRENLPFLFISGGTFEQYSYLQGTATSGGKVIAVRGPTKDNTLITGGTFNKVGKADVDPQDIETLLSASIPVYAQKKDAETDGFFTVELIPVALDIDAGEGVTDFTYTVNGDEPVDGQRVKFGDVIKITDVTYAAGYKPGAITKDTEITVGEELLVDEDGELVDAVVVTVDAAKCFGGGSGVIDDPYIIETYDHLVELQAWVAEGKPTAGVYFQQKADIDFAGKDPWTGIGDQYTLTNPKAFEGSYDGNDCKISNVIFGGVADSSGKCKYNGFFNFTKNASFANLTIDVAGLDPNVTVAFGAAAFVGYAKGDTISFENCVADGTISGTHNVAGFMVGGEVAGTFLNCTNKATIATTDDRAAGFVNINTRNDGVIFTYTNCKNEGDVSAQATGGTACGFHGYVTATKTHTIQFTNCENTGTLAATYVGSFAGVLHVGTLANMGGNVAQAEYPVYGMSDSTADKYATVGFTYGKVEAGKATYIATLVKDTEYDQFSNDESETIFTLAAKDDWIAFKTPADGITAPTIEQIAVADDSIKVEVDEEYTDGIKFVAVAAQTEPIPVIDPTDEKYAEKVAAVVATLTDTTAKKFVSTENYSAFQTWANGVGQDKVVASPEAFLCYALGMDDVLAKALTSEDVEIKAYNKDTGVIEVEIEGVTPGTKVPEGELAKVLSAVGGEALDGMTAAKVNVSGQCVEAGKIQVTVTPKDTTATAFFIKAELVK